MFVKSAKGFLIKKKNQKKGGTHGKIGIGEEVIG